MIHILLLLAVLVVQAQLSMENPDLVPFTLSQHGQELPRRAYAFKDFDVTIGSPWFASLLIRFERTNGGLCDVPRGVVVTANGTPLNALWMTHGEAFEINSWHHIKLMYNDKTLLEIVPLRDFEPQNYSQVKVMTE